VFKIECSLFFIAANMSTAAANVVEVPYRTFMCVVCGFIYNEAEGWPGDGIAPGTRWEDVPETWTCPDCGVTKSDFEMVEIG
jgi:rubredoxin